MHAASNTPHRSKWGQSLAGDRCELQLKLKAEWGKRKVLSPGDSRAHRKSEDSEHFVRAVLAVNLKRQTHPRLASSSDIWSFLHPVLGPRSIGVTLFVPVSRRLSVCNWRQTVSR